MFERSIDAFFDELVDDYDAVYAEDLLEDLADSTACTPLFDDVRELMITVHDLRQALGQSPLIWGTVSAASNRLQSMRTRIVQRLRNRFYVRQKCTRDDMKGAAGVIRSIQNWQWPQLSSRRTKMVLADARETLRLVLSWLQRADRNFPRI